MLRAILIYLSQAGWARRIVTGWSFARRSAARFVAGETCEEAIKAIKQLNELGINGTVDHLGEHTTSDEGAHQATGDIKEIFDAIEQSGVRANVSIKLTQIGLALDRELCARNLEAILTHARGYNNFVRLDMEDSPWVDATLELYWRMRKQKGFDNVGVVFQAYLYRCKNDQDAVIAENGRVRLCKGAYIEPPNIAYPSKRDVDENFDSLACSLLEAAGAPGAPKLSADGKWPPIPAIATHDVKRIEYARRCMEKFKLPKDAMEFQMLYGIRRDLQKQLIQDGYRVRVYVPFGTEWYPFFVRRLAERPANLWFLISNLFRG